ncbi:DUF456 domain-containing protein [Mycobacterium sp. CBMA293]|uniref:DUF456 domain-containing protein n=1 Tax=unclassified Mycolicibacterium TaxID=2636767 RepID=UPI00132B1B79|nr:MULTISPECIES: DUF456 domain-containing protein [unclassified Mycolicibacterium]MUL47523.1 DUF456 domain-containing protein [Mycolicibacterium sp. CBMA 360]MUL94878.1 DUF456 domain-containing protein [Mycolicibacterium sp. CBMA 230]MUM31407.1 DUF456 domain-containing protein [Mycolicibacterium sp. CBMA 361]MUL59510.1 DUF456 domain-containing protein [Mycolicibacterium sp. CBMA 335]MUL71235.1 DUF456 domain-containing protein [Mycolicibacterium sp. CBMA 311]
MNTLGLVLVALVIAIGLGFIVVPVLPGGLIVFLAIAVWALVVHTAVAWVVLGVAACLFLAGEVIKYLWPMRRMRQADVATRSLILGGILGVIGFFAIPVLGLALGFVLGVYLSEHAALRDAGRAWTSTKHAIKGVALAIGVELTAALLSTVAWVVGVFA